MRSAKADQVAGDAGRFAQQTTGETEMGLFAVVDKMAKLQDENEWLKSALIGSQNEVERLTAKLAEANGELEQAYTLLEYRAESGRIREAAKAPDSATLSKSLYEGWSK